MIRKLQKRIQKIEREARVNDGNVLFKADRALRGLGSQTSPIFKV